MKVRELIKVLKTLNQETEIRFYDSEYGDSPIDEIYSLFEDPYTRICYFLNDSAMWTAGEGILVWRAENEQKSKPTEAESGSAESGSSGS